MEGFQIQSFYLTVFQQSSGEDTQTGGCHQQTSSVITLQPIRHRVEFPRHEYASAHYLSTFSTGLASISVYSREQ